MTDQLAVYDETARDMAAPSTPGLGMAALGQGGM